MFENINRISIIGGSGTGKTTLANSLGKVLIFKNRNELNKWYYTQFNEKIIL